MNILRSMIPLIVAAASATAVVAQTPRRPTNPVPRQPQPTPQPSSPKPNNPVPNNPEPNSPQPSNPTDTTPQVVQPSQTHNDYASARVQRLLDGINLTAEQRAQVDSILTSYSLQLPAVNPDVAPDSTSRERIRTLMLAQDVDIRRLLTSDQQRLWDRNVENNLAERPRRP